MDSILSPFDIDLCCLPEGTYHWVTILQVLETQEIINGQSYPILNFVDMMALLAASRYYHGLLNIGPIQKQLVLKSAPLLRRLDTHQVTSNGRYITPKSLLRALGGYDICKLLFSYKRPSMPEELRSLLVYWYNNKEADLLGLLGVVYPTEKLLSSLFMAASLNVTSEELRELKLCDTVPDGILTYESSDSTLITALGNSKVFSASDPHERKVEFIRKCLECCTAFTLAAILDLISVSDTTKALASYVASMDPDEKLGVIVSYLGYSPATDHYLRSLLTRIMKLLCTALSNDVPLILPSIKTFLTDFSQAISDSDKPGFCETILSHVGDGFDKNIQNVCARLLFSSASLGLEKWLVICATNNCRRCIEYTLGVVGRERVREHLKSACACLERLGKREAAELLNRGYKVFPRRYLC